MNVAKLIGNFNFKKFNKASRTDFGVFKVAFMTAAAKELKNLIAEEEKRT